MSDSKKKFFISLTICLIAWAASFFIFWNIYERRESVDRLTQEAMYLSNKKEEIKTLSSDLDRLSPRIHELDDFIVGNTQEAVVDFIELIESVAAFSGSAIDINSVSVSSFDGSENGDDSESDLDSKEGYEYLDIDLRVAGSWEQIFQFLNLVENIPYKAAIEEVSLSTTGGIFAAVNQPKWEGVFLLKVVKFKR